MSRLYDALTEANRIRRGLGGNGKYSPLPKGLDGIDIPHVHPSVEDSAPPAGITAENIRWEPVPFAAETATVPEPPAPAAPPAGRTEYPGLPTATALDRKARLIPHSIDSSVVEYYRRLRTKILQKRDEKPFQTLLVTSANPKEGKTVTVLNLGLSFAMLPDFKVLVIDGDLRRGSLGNWLGVPAQQAGLSDVVAGAVRLEDVVLKSEAIPMHFMVRGNSKVADAHASQYDVHFRRLAGYFDLVIVDSPPVNLLADVQIMARCCEAVLLVARSFVTSRQELEKAVQNLEPFNVIGTILNASRNPRARYYSDYY